MLRILLLICFISTTASAQTAPVYPSIITSPNQFIKADTVRAINNLFARRRTGGTIGMSISGVSFSLLLPITTSPGNNVFDAVKAITLLGVVPATLSTIKYARFTKKREHAILNAYGKGKPLPLYVKRRLSSRYF